MLADKYTLTFTIRGTQFNSSSFSDYIGIDASLLHSVGERGRPNSRISSLGGWEWQCGPATHPQELLEEFLQTFQPVEQKLITILNQDSELQTKLYVFGENYQTMSYGDKNELHGEDIGFYLQPKELNFLSKINVTLDFATTIYLTSA